MRNSNSAGQATHAPLVGQARAQRAASSRRLRQSAPATVPSVSATMEGCMDDAHLVFGLQTSDLINEAAVISADLCSLLGSLAD